MSKVRRKKAGLDALRDSWEDHGTKSVRLAREAGYTRGEYTRKIDEILSKSETEVQRIIDSLPAQDREFVLSILRDVRQSKDPKHSAAFQGIWEIDYRWKPIPIEQFLDDPYYLGQSTETLFPVWRKVLCDVFSPKSIAWEMHLGGAVGGGKSWSAMIAISFLLYKLSCLRHPQRFHGLAPHSRIVFGVYSVTREQSLEVGYDKLYCTPIYSRVLTQRGYVPISEIKNTSDSVVTYDGKRSYLSSFGGVVFVGKRRCIRIRTSSGRVVDCSLNHKLLVRQKDEKVWKEAGLLNVGEVLCESTVPLLPCAETTQRVLPQKEKRSILHQRPVHYVPSRTAFAYWKDQASSLGLQIDTIDETMYSVLRDEKCTGVQQGQETQPQWDSREFGSVLQALSEDKESRNVRKMDCETGIEGRSSTEPNEAGSGYQIASPRSCVEKEKSRCGSTVGDEPTCPKKIVAARPSSRLEKTSSRFLGKGVRVLPHTSGDNDGSRGSFDRVWRNHVAECGSGVPAVQFTEEPKERATVYDGEGVHVAEDVGEVEETRIVSIEDIGEVECCDVLNVPYTHLVFLEGVAASNSFVTTSPYFNEKCPYDTKRTSTLWFPSIRTVALYGSQEIHVLGKDLYSIVLDEVNFMHDVSSKKRSTEKGQAEKLYNNTVSRLKSRYMQAGGAVPGMAILVSSRASEGAFMERRAKDAAEEIAAGSVKVFGFSLWEAKAHLGIFTLPKFYVEIGDRMYPSRILEATNMDRAQKEARPNARVLEVPGEMKPEFMRDLDEAIRAIAGIATYGIMPLLRERHKIYECCKKATWVHPFTAQEVPLSDQDKIELDEYFEPLKMFRIVNSRYEPLIDPHMGRFIHIDIGLRHDALGMVCGHVHGMQSVTRYSQDGTAYTSRAPEIYLDFILRVIPPKQGSIDLSKVRSFLFSLREKGLPIERVSFDGYQSEDAAQILTKAGFECVRISVDKTPDAYLSLRQSILDTRTAFYEHHHFIKEVEHLERDLDANKVDHPARFTDGSIGSKDVADGGASVVYQLTSSTDAYKSLATPVTGGPMATPQHAGSTMTKRDVDWDLVRSIRERARVQ